MRAIAPRRKQCDELRDDDTRPIGRGLGRIGNNKSITAYVKPDEHIERIPGSVSNGNSKSKPFMWTLDHDAAVRAVVLKHPALSDVFSSVQTIIVHCYEYNNRVIFSSTVLFRLASSSSMWPEGQGNRSIKHTTLLGVTHKSSLTLKLENDNATHVRVVKHMLSSQSSTTLAASKFTPLSLPLIACDIFPHVSVAPRHLALSACTSTE